MHNIDVQYGAMRAAKITIKNIELVLSSNNGERQVKITNSVSGTITYGNTVSGYLDRLFLSGKVIVLGQFHTFNYK